MSDIVSLSNESKYNQLINYFVNLKLIIEQNGLSFSTSGFQFTNILLIKGDLQELLNEFKEITILILDNFITFLKENPSIDEDTLNSLFKNKISSTTLDVTRFKSLTESLNQSYVDLQNNPGVLTLIRNILIKYLNAESLLRILQNGSVKMDLSALLMKEIISTIKPSNIDYLSYAFELNETQINYMASLLKLEPSKIKELLEISIGYYNVHPDDDDTGNALQENLKTLLLEYKTQVGMLDIDNNLLTEILELFTEYSGGLGKFLYSHTQQLTGDLYNNAAYILSHGFQWLLLALSI